MTSARVRTAPVSGSSGPVLVLLGGGAALIGFMQIAGFAHSGDAWWVILYPVAGLVYVAAGLAALWRRPSNRLGVIMVFGGLSWFTVALANAQSVVLAATGTVLATVPLAVVVHLVLALPSGRLRSPAAVLVVRACYVICLVLQVPLYLFAPGASPGGVLAVADRPALATAGLWVQASAGLVDVTVAAVILAGRMRRAAPQQRRVLGPLYLYGIAAVLFIPFAGSVLPIWGISSGVIGALQVIVLTGVPVTFAVSILLGGFARTSEIQELGAWLGATAAGRPSLTEAVARALGDPSVRLAYRVAGQDAYLDADGGPAELPAAGTGRAAAGIELRGERIGVIIYDAVLLGDAELVRAAGRVVAMAVAHERLDAELRASQQALQQSRARLVEAADAERRRIARNLHDGLQVKLVLLALEAQRLAGQPGATRAVEASATRLRSRIDAAAGELRELVHAVMPAPLIERGLGAAAQDLVDRMPLPTQLDLGVNGSLPREVSAAAYFVVAETLANAVKHAQARSLAVRLACERDILFIEVADDGIGGVHAGQGLGLRSLADRVDVLGGTLRIHSPAGCGTQVVVELPCKS
jgi:signal transduction histidine kinase